MKAISTALAGAALLALGACDQFAGGANDSANVADAARADNRADNSARSETPAANNAEPPASSNASGSADGKPAEGGGGQAAGAGEDTGSKPAGDSSTDDAGSEGDAATTDGEGGK